MIHRHPRPLVGVNRLFAFEGVGVVGGVGRVVAGYGGRGLPMMEIPTPSIRKTSTCPILALIALI